MSRASLVTAAIAVVGAIVAWRFLPARAVDEEAVEETVARQPAQASVTPIGQPRPQPEPSMASADHASG
jgi:hypothetical protein